MTEFLWNAVNSVLTIFVILSIFTLIGVVLSAAYAWWNGADPLGAFVLAFLSVVIAGFAWHWILL